MLVVTALPCSADGKLKVQIRAMDLNFTELLGPGSQQGAELAFELDCVRVSVPMTSAAGHFETCRDVTACCLMRWLLRCGISRVSLAWSGEDSGRALKVLVHCRATHGFHRCRDLAAAINDARAMLPAASLPAFTCKEVNTAVGNSIVEFVRALRQSEI